VTPGPALLFELDEPDLQRAARDSRYPKWATLCLLHSLGHPVLNACCIFPSDGSASLLAGIDRLLEAVGPGRLLLRSDGGVETARYPQGGNTFELDRLLRRARHLLSLGRAVILMEPTNRFTNRLSAVLRIDQWARQHKGSLVVETLGPGFDVSDLTRGGITPQLRASVGSLSWCRYERPWRSDFQVTLMMSPEREQIRRQQRIARVTDVLVDLNQLPRDAAVDAADGWLRSNGYTALWDRWDPARAIRELSRWYEDAFLVGNALLGRPWRCLAMSFSRLDDGRAVYWDVVDGQHKFGPQRVHRSVWSALGRAQ
jgi:hypothetical protein